MNSSKNTNKREKIDTMRMKDIISQLADIIYLLCNAKKNNITIILDQLTNLTKEERDILNLNFPNDTDE